MVLDQAGKTALFSNRPIASICRRDHLLLVEFRHSTVSARKATFPCGRTRLAAKRFFGARRRPDPFRPPSPPIWNPRHFRDSARQALFKCEPVAWWRCGVLKEGKPDVRHTWPVLPPTHTAASPRDSSLRSHRLSERCVDSWKSGWQLWLDRNRPRERPGWWANFKASPDFYRDTAFARPKFAFNS